MVMDICLDCGFVHQWPGDLRYTCSKCDRVTYHAILRGSVRPDGLCKEDFDLENFYAGCLK